MKMSFRGALCFVAIANLAYFFIEFLVAIFIDSVSLFADSIDFLEDSFVNILILLALNWSVKARAKVGMILAALIVVPGLSTLWMAADKFFSFTPPEAIPLSITGLGAFIVNLVCAFVLVTHRHNKGSLAKAAFLSARNDVFANVAIIIAGLSTAYFVSAWPDLIVGVGIALLNAGAAKEVWEAAREEHLKAKA